MVRSTRSRRATRRAGKRGGGWSQGPALSQTAYYVPEYKMYSECYPMDRPGMIQSNPNPALAQTAMAGGGCGCGMIRGGSRRRQRLLRRKRTGTCGYYGARGGRRTRKQRGGRYGVDPSTSVGGDGPNVAPTWAHVPCEAHRPMPLNPVSATALGNSPNPEVFVSGLRPAFIGGSRRRRQRGGAAYTPAPLAYTAPRAGFTFVPNIAQGQVVGAGQIPYEVVVPQHDDCGATCGTAIAAINKA